MAIKFDTKEFYSRTDCLDSSTLKAICEHINGFGEADYKHITDGIIKILKDEGLIK